MLSRLLYGSYISTEALCRVCNAFTDKRLLCAGHSPPPYSYSPGPYGGGGYTPYGYGMLVHC